jgi:acetyltransferase-like isoleucine patch superfamily enzyme
MGYYTDIELAELGLASVGRNVRLSRRAAIHGASRIAIGDNSRIDDFCVLSAGEGGIEIGRYVHLAVMVSLIGRGLIRIMDLSTLSGRVSVYSSSDDYSGEFMTNPTIPAKNTRVDHRPVTIGRHVVVGCGTVILPGAELEDGSAVGAQSLVKGRLRAFTICGGVPARVIKARQRGLIALEQQLGEL